MRDWREHHWKTLLVISSILSIVLLFGCSGGNSVAGKYVSQDKLDSLDLRRDGTCYMEEYGSRYKGTYKVNGTEITAQFEVGRATGTIEGKTIVGISLWEADKTWVKK